VLNEAIGDRGGPARSAATVTLFAANPPLNRTTPNVTLAVTVRTAWRLGNTAAAMCWMMQIEQFSKKIQDPPFCSSNSCGRP
jgi:hypothetical protein